MGNRHRAKAPVDAAAKRLTATQDRNARKRAAKKTVKGQTSKDPSLRYIADPLNAPTVLQARRFFRDCGTKSFEVHVGPTSGWRTVAKLAVRKGVGGVEIGLFEPGTHNICRVDNCLAHHPSINDAVSLIEMACRDLGVNGYDEGKGTGELRYLQVEVQRCTKKVQLTLVWHSASQADAGPRLSSLVQELLHRQPELWYSIWANFHPASKHVSRIVNYDASSWHHLAGKKKTLRERLLSCPCPYEHPQLCFPPNVFRQANLCAFENIVTAIRRFVLPRTRVVELYAGVGTIGLHLADLVASLECSDENPNNQRCFELSLRSLPEDLAARLEYNTGDAISQVLSLRKAEIVVVDPPRKGLDDPVVQALENPPDCLQRLVYVSCGFPAFQRDAGRLLQAGWKIQHAEGFVLFPGADHMETLCVFDPPKFAGKLPAPTRPSACSSRQRKRAAEATGAAAIVEVAAGAKRSKASRRHARAKHKAAAAATE